MRVMGVDPGLTRCGLSVIESGRGRQVTALDVDVVRTPSDETLARRLLVADGHLPSSRSLTQGSSHRERPAEAGLILLCCLLSG